MSAPPTERSPLGALSRSKATGIACEPDGFGVQWEQVAYQR